MLEAIKSNPGQTKKELAMALGISENGIKYHIALLKKDGKIIHRGFTKSGYWEVK